MAQLPSILNIIKYAKISEYLAANDIAKSQIFFNGNLDKQLPVKIYESRLALQWAYDLGYTEASATATFYVTLTPDAKVFDSTFDNTFGSYNVNQLITVKVQDPILGEIVIGTYKVQPTDTTAILIAQNLALAINQYGYSAVSNGIAVTVTAPLALGSSINGIYLSITVTTSYPYIFDQTFSNTFN